MKSNWRASTKIASRFQTFALSLVPLIRLDSLDISSQPVGAERRQAASISLRLVTVLDTLFKYACAH
jgi:hypothetical protein